MINKKSRNSKYTPFQNATVANVFHGYPEKIREKLLDLRELIFDVAAKTEGVGELKETLKWDQPSYLPSKTKSGTTVRLDQVTSNPGVYAVYTHCQTSLVDDFKKKYGDEFEYEKNRGVRFKVNEKLPAEKIRGLISAALTYHLKKK